MVPLTKPDRSKLSKLRKINVYKYPASISELNWKSTTVKSLTQEAIDTHSMSTSLAQMQGSQLINTPSTSPTPSPTAFAKVADDPDYCAICKLLGKDCPGKIGLSFYWDEEDDRAKVRDQKQPEASPNLFIRPTQTLKPSKPYITKYFDSMSSDTPIIYKQKEK